MTPAETVKSLRSLAATLKAMDMPNYAKTAREAAKILSRTDKEDGMDPIKEAMIREEDTGEINPDLDWFRERPGVRHFLEQRDELVAALSATVGYMRNAQIDLETGAPKKTAVQTIQGCIRLAEAALAKTAGCPVCGRSSDTQDCERDACGVMQPAHQS